MLDTSSEAIVDSISMETLEITNPSRPVRSRLRLITIVGALQLALFIAALDEMIVATAIPTITSSLHSASGYTWIGGAYLLAVTASAPIWAKVSDIWGRKPALLFVVAWFFVSSIVCATAETMNVLIAGRVLQGLGGGAVLQLTTITISDLFSMKQRALQFGLLQTTWALAGTAGPVLGGAFSQYVSWRWIFWINLPVAGIAFALLLLLDVHDPKTPLMDGIKAIDWYGSLSIIGLTVMLLLGLDFGGVIFAWNSPKIICLIVFGAFMSVLFIISEKRLARYPLMPLGVFKSLSNSAALMVTFAHGFVFMALGYYLPLYFQATRAATPIWSAVYVLPLTLIEAIAGALVGYAVHKTGHYREFIWSGFVLTTLGCGLLINLDARSSIGKIIAYEVVTAIGVGFLFDPPLISLQAHANQQDVGTTTSTFMFIRNVALAVSVVASGAVFDNGMLGQASYLRAAGLSSSLTAMFTSGQASAYVDTISGIADLAQRKAVEEAYASSLRNVWIMLTVIAAMGGLCSVWIQHSALSDTHVETRTGLEKLDEVPQRGQERAV